MMNDHEINQAANSAKVLMVQAGQQIAARDPWPACGLEEYFVCEGVGSFFGKDGVKYVVELTVRPEQD